jgi:hypothetical protein
MNEARPSPPRFVDASGPTGQLLRQVLAEQELHQALPRFIDLRERRSRRLRLRRAAAALMTTLLAALAAWALHSPGEAPVIRAEHARAVQEPVPPAALAAERPLASPASSAPAPSVRAAAVASSDKPKPRAARAALAPLGAVASAQPPTAPPSTVAPPASAAAELTGAKVCAGIARSGAAERAIACYEGVARGSGISAELALFEQARLAGKVLNQPDRALRTLQNHRERFPRGALRAEVMLAQIDWLVTSGQSSRALALVDEALRSGLLRERTAELERVRARLERELAAPR